MLLAMLFGLLAPPALAKKTDFVVMDNGNRFVGEINILEQGLWFVRGDTRVRYEF